MHHKIYFNHGHKSIPIFVVLVWVAFVIFVKPCHKLCSGIGECIQPTIGQCFAELLTTPAFWIVTIIMKIVLFGIVTLFSYHYVKGKLEERKEKIS
ncbi:hypothetical protein HQ533_04820 [Candidatus Woesearchaeota archaeon]|nr:hypothetical protein [Candidatus Woesearchaeota archaeon]